MRPTCNRVLSPMSLRSKIASGSMLLTVGAGIGHAASFIRYMILARVLSKADFAIAATLGMIMVLFEFSAKLGVARFVVQDKEGDQPDTGALVALLDGVRGNGVCVDA